MLLSRRALCVGICQAAACSALGILAEGCSGASPTAPSSIAQLPTVNGSAVDGGISVALGDSPALSSVGGAALVLSPRGYFLLARTDPNTFSALPATCTHQTCTVSGFNGGVYVCPCHGSQFSKTGQVLSGPAVLPLRQLPTIVNSDTVTIVV